VNAVPRDEWIVALPADDPRYVRLLGNVTAQELILAVERDVEAQLSGRNITPIFEPANRYPPYKRFAAEIRLSEQTFDLLINGRMGYRAQYYLSLEQGRRFNRDVVDALTPLMEVAWKESSNEEWPLAHRSLTGSDAKVWPALDETAFEAQPKLKPPMWVINCDETRASKRGLHLASTNPPKIELKGAWVSAQHGEYWIATGKRCRDELLRCFGFT
jgi:hypothetical protein